jgi:hypothetical protein
VAHPAFYPMGTGAPSPEVKRPRREADHSPRTSAKVKIMWFYTYTPPSAFMAYCLISYAQRLFNFLADFPYPEKIALCVYISPLSTSECLNQSYETWYVYHGTWAHLNGVLHKSPSVSVFACVSRLVARERNEYTRNKRWTVERVVFYAVRVVSRKVGD